MTDSEVEAELVKATKYRPKGNPSRQDFLAGLLIAIDQKLSDEQYDLLSDTAAQWHKDAVQSLEAKRVIPDFPDLPDAPPITEPPPYVAPVPEADYDGKTPVSQRMVPDYENLSGEIDRFGLYLGTKTQKAVEMYEKGCTAKEIMDNLGGRFYNILKKLKGKGHKVTKDGPIWKLTHKDDVGK